MIGAGVFTSLGYQVLGLSSGYSILLVWLVGGIVSLLGAMCYAELAGRLSGSGGEYNFLTQIYGKPIGFAAGWISFTVGFSAPIAAACMALGTYFSYSFKLENVQFINVKLELYIAISALIILTLLQIYHRAIGAIFQNITTTFKIIVIVILIISGFIFADGEVVQKSFNSSWNLNELLKGGFWISLFYVSYAYSGWNASAYIANEIENPKKNIPRSLILGTAIVTTLYILLNLIFMFVLPFEEMAGKKEIGYLYANKILGAVVGGLIGLVISGLLVSSISSMIITGPRVTSSMANDHRLFNWFSKTNSDGIPQRAILFQSMLCLVYIFSAKFDQIMIFVGFTLNLFTLLTVFGLFIVRYRKQGVEPEYKVFGYPIIPLVFILLYLFLLGFGIVNKPFESLLGLGFAICGVVIYGISNLFKTDKFS